MIIVSLKTVKAELPSLFSHIALRIHYLNAYCAHLHGIHQPYNFKDKIFIPFV